MASEPADVTRVPLPPASGGGLHRGLRMNWLTAMRAIAAAFVFLFHITSPGISPLTGSIETNLQNWSLCLGTAAVSCFFMLSGFVLTWSLRPGRSPGYFIRRRLARIFPNHVTTFALAMVLFAAAATPANIWIRNLLLLQAWVPDLHAMWSVNQPSWSLSCELFFYLCFPLLYAGIRRIKPSRLWIWAGAVALLVVAVPAIAYLALPGQDKLSMYGIPVSVQQYWFVYVFPPVRILEFILGSLMARIIVSGRWIKIPHGWAFALFVAGYALTFHLPYLYRYNAATVIPLALLIAAVTVDEGNGGRSPLGFRWLVRAGDLSFAFYMTQGVILVAASGLLVVHQRWDLWQGLGILSAYCLTCGAVAWFLNVGVERPAFAYLTSRWVRPPRSVVVSGAGSAAVVGVNTRPTQAAADNAPPT
jgi:peptidoglycan/LPS O-acetylase OafA/YrhL